MYIMKVERRTIGGGVKRTSKNMRGRIERKGEKNETKGNDK